ILQELIDRDYGSREFICCDPEGNVWSFGTYWPKADEAAG
ncbi:MAG: glyoxalase, partial [Mesorhizobium sp.]